MVFRSDNFTFFLSLNQCALVSAGEKMHDGQVPKSFSRRRLNHPNSGKRWNRKQILFLVGGIGIILFFAPLLQLIFSPWGVFFFDAGKILGARYLVLLQNEAELRPAGGFISAFAIVETRLGKPNITIYDSYAVASPSVKLAPPWPLEEVFSEDPKYRGWEFRDSNFFADFPESSGNSLELLHQDPKFSAMEFDGVIAINLAAIEKLIEPEEANESLFYRLQRETKDIDLHSPVDLQNRKNILSELTKELMGSIGYFSLPQTLAQLATAADTKNLQLWFTDEELQKKVKKKGWDGALPKESFFGVNVANLGAKKSDRYVRREYRSEVDVAANGEMAETFEIRLRHEGTAGLLSGEGRYVIQVFRPKGTKIAGNQNGWVQQTNENMEYFSLLTTLAPGDDLIIKIDLLLPGSWREREYIFPWVKQSGTEDLLTLVLRGKSDVRFAADGCDTKDARENVLFCDVRLTSNKVVSAQLQPDTLPPIVESMLFQNEREIFIRFSEPIEAKGTEDAFELDCPQKRLKAEEIVNNPEDLRDSTIVLPEPLLLDGSFCTVTWKGIADLAGNPKNVKMTLPRRKE